ncbi:MAG: metal ABC transporter substrate-binding protein, partial [Lachnospiraceae bacterium]|nr:metal ABC transporter substrate-binding protein [Lachnospiraceae bacterium]
MKKYISIILAVVLSICGLSACGQADSNQTTEKDEKQIKVVTTIFPEYDWVREIAGDESDHVDLTMLLDNGVDLHSYQPTSEDIMKISDCDLFIYVGGESDAWVEDALKEAVNKDMKVINLLDVLGNSVKEEEVVEGMEAEEEESEEESEEEEEPEYDEHVWLSLKNAKVFCKAIADDLSEIDKDYAETYQKNEENYAAKLDELDQNYQKTVDEASQKTLLFGDRFPFRYMVDDYGLDYYA